MSLFVLILCGVGGAIWYLYDAPEALIIAFVFSVLLNGISYWNSDKIVLMTTGARPASRERFFDFYTVTENLSITAGLPMPKLYVIHDPAPNAFATGRDAKHAAVAVTTGLLEILTRTELEGVVAHELSHIGNRDILLQSVVVVLVGLIALIADWFLRFSLFGGRGRDRDSGQAGAIFAILSIVFIILSPVAAMLIQLAISRKREYLADASGALLTRYPEGLASALGKIHASGLKMRRAGRATAHLFISDPFGKKMSGLFATHPPVEKRIAALRGSGV